MTPHDHDLPTNDQPPEKKPEAFCVEFKPTIWHRLGFGECSAPRLEDKDYPGMAPATLQTRVLIHFGWSDRLRLLISGNAMVHTSHKTEEPIEGRVVSTSAVSVMCPGAVKVVKP